MAHPNFKKRNSELWDINCDDRQQTVFGLWIAMWLFVFCTIVSTMIFVPVLRSLRAEAVGRCQIACSAMRYVDFLYFMKPGPIVGHLRPPSQEWATYC